MMSAEEKRAYGMWYRQNKSLHKIGHGKCRICGVILPVEDFKHSSICTSCRKRREVFKLGVDAL